MKKTAGAASLQRWAGRFVGSFAAVAALGLGGAGMAQAAVYVGTFDPVFGSPFNNPELGWRGTATFDVGTSCISPGLVTVGGACGATVTQLRLEFYDNQATPVNSVKPTLAFIDFALAPEIGGPTNGADDRSLSRLFFSPSNDLLGVSLGLGAYGFKLPTIVSGDPFGNNIPDFGMAFNLGALGLPSEGPYNGPLVSWRRGQGCGDRCNGTNDTTGAGIPVFTIQQVGGTVITVPPAVVSAPGTAWLAGLALFGALLASRRRRAG